MANDRVEVDVVVTGQNAVDRLDASIKDLKKQVTDLTAAFDAGKSSPAEYAKAMGQLNGQIAQQEALLQDLKRKGGSAIAEFANNYRFQILNMGRATQDFVQGGIGGILNNIEGLVKSPVVASLATVFAAALYAGWPSIKKWFDSFNAEWDETSEDHIKKAREELDKFSESFRKLQGYATPEEEQAAKGLTAYLQQEGRAGAVRAAVTAGIITGKARLEDLPVGMIEALKPEERERLEQDIKGATRADKEIRQQAYMDIATRLPLGAEVPAASVEGRFQELKRDQAAILGRVAEQAAGMLVGAALQPGRAGEPARQFVAGAAEGRPGMEGLAQFTPEKMREAKAQQMTIDMMQQEWKREDKEREERNRRSEQLTVQGQEQEQQHRDEQEREQKKAEDKRRHDADQARHKAEQDRKQTVQMFEHFDRMPGFMGLDAAAAEFAGMDARQRAEHEQRLRRDARQMLLMQGQARGEQMAPEEATRRAAEYPGFLRQRYRGMEAEAAGAARMQGIDLSDVAAAQGLSEQQVRYNLTRDQAAQQAFQRLLQSMEHSNRQAAQSARQWDRAAPETTRFGDASGFGG